MAPTTNRISTEETAPMKIIGLISDTHIPSRAKVMPSRVFEIFRNASLIIHAGDLTQLSVMDELEQLAPVVAVRGNMDSPEVKARLPVTNAAKVDNCRIGVVHSLGLFGSIRKMPNEAQTAKFNALVFGHTHSPTIKRENGVLLINPGSPTNPMLPFITKPTVGLLKIFEGKIEPEIVQIDS